MRLLIIFHKRIKSWSLGFRRCWNWLDFNSKSRRLEFEQVQLKEKLYLSELRVGFLEEQIKSKDAEIEKQKHAVNKLSTFIHRRHRLDMPTEKGSIKDVLQRLERQ